MPTHDLTADDLDSAIAFLDTYYRDEIGELLQRYPTDQDYLEVSYQDLFRWSAQPKATDLLRDRPDVLHELLEEALANYDVPIDVDLSGATVRIHDLPSTETLGVDQVWQAKAGEFVGVRGQVQKKSDVKHEPTMLAFECLRCGYYTDVNQPDNADLQEPHECSGCERQGPFRIDMSNSDTRPHQLVRVQQPPEETKGGNASHIDVPLTGSLVNEVQAGDRVTLTGTHELEPTDNGLFDSYVQGEAADVEETDFEEIDTSAYMDEIEAIASGEYGPPLEAIVESIAPKVKGHDEIKKAIALQFFSGVRVEYPDGSIDRGDFHTLLIGAPGTAKSTFLRFVEKVAPRSVYASGKGASAAGMTAAAVRDDFGATEWALEAGALVLANKGIACVDEIDKIEDDARSSLHDALESQRVNINKAGINATLPAQTSMLAAGNPKYGRFEPHSNDSFSEQIDLGPTLLSRFDLIFLLHDTPDEQQDRGVGKHMVESRRLANAYSDPNTATTADDVDTIQPTIDKETLRAYIAHAKQKVRPRIDDEAVAEELVDTFVTYRLLNGGAEDVAVPVTFRKLEGLQRLAEASARLRLSETVEEPDVDVARQLVMDSMQQVGLDEDGKFDADVVEAGTSKSQRDRIQVLRDIVGDLADEHEFGAPRSDVINCAEDQGIDPDRADKDLNKLKLKGEIYEPMKEHHYRLT